MNNLIDKIAKGAEIVDDFTESAEERQATLTLRHKHDMNSDNWLSKSIRPISLLVLLALQIAIVILSAFSYNVDPVIVGQHGILLSAAFGFYFSSRKAEKVAAQNAKASIEVEKIKVKSDIRQQRKELRHQRRLERRKSREQDGN